MHCQHNRNRLESIQRVLKHKTTHKEHNNKNTCCPAQIIVTLLPPKTHNHLTDVADALRFRPISESIQNKDTMTYSDKVILHLVPTLSMKHI